MTSHAFSAWRCNCTGGRSDLLLVAPLLSLAILRITSAPRLETPGVALAALRRPANPVGGRHLVSKYGVPAALIPAASTMTLQAEGMLASILATAHVANGALVLGTSTLIAIRSSRYARPGQEAQTGALSRERPHEPHRADRRNRRTLVGSACRSFRRTDQTADLAARAVFRAAAGFAATGESTSFWLIASTVLGTGLVAASATIGNQILEVELDARMARTAGARCLPGVFRQPRPSG